MVAKQNQANQEEEISRLDKNQPNCLKQGMNNPNKVRPKDFDSNGY